MSEFGLKKSFGIDGGELDGLSPQECFVLGYELALVDHLLTTGQSIRQPVHADNRDRIEASCKDAERAFDLKWLPGDESESWLLLEVAEAGDPTT
jgi:Ser/Thr protein kinase RdoA (MazF antagonist)